MKPLRSMITMRSCANKKMQLPLLKSKKEIIKPYNQTIDHKSSLVINIRLLPLQIILAHPHSPNKTLLLSPQDLKIQSSKQTKLLPLAMHGYKWVHFVVPEPYNILKMNPQNGQTISMKGNMFYNVEELIISKPEENIKAIYKLNIGQCELVDRSSEAVNKQEDHTEVKKFITSLMSKKLGQKNIKSISKNQSIDSQHRNIPPHYRNLGGTVGSNRECDSSISVRNRINRGSRHLQNNPLKQSGYVGKSEKQTSIGGDKSILVKDSIRVQPSWNLDLDEKEYSRRLMKFDSINIKECSLFGIKNNTQSKFKPKNSLNSNSVSMAPIKLQKQIQKEDEPEEVEENIIVDSKVEDQKKLKESQSDVFQSAFEKVKKQEQSHLDQSKMIQSSGTIYQSRYE